MVSKKRRKHYSPEFKAKVARKALSGTQSNAEIAKEFSVHRNQVSRWKNHALKNLSTLFEHKSKENKPDPQTSLINRLSKKLKQRCLELKWLRTKISPDVKQKCEFIEPKHARISIKRQCRILGLNASTFFNKNRK